MKYTSLFLLLVTAGAFVLPFAGCSKSDPTTAAHDAKQVSTETWDSIKDFTFAQRDDFAATLDRLVKAYDTHLAAMNATLEGLPNESANAHNAAVKAFNSASAEFKLQLTALRAGTADTWEVTKEKTTVAWRKVQSTFDAIPQGKS